MVDNAITNWLKDENIPFEVVSDGSSKDVLVRVNGRWGASLAVSCNRQGEAIELVTVPRIYQYALKEEGWKPEQMFEIFRDLVNGNYSVSTIVQLPFLGGLAKVKPANKGVPSATVFLGWKYFKRLLSRDLFRPEDLIR